MAWTYLSTEQLYLYLIFNRTSWMGDLPIASFHLHRATWTHIHITSGVSNIAIQIF